MFYVRKKYFYQKPTPDTNVYLRYIGGKKRQKLSYYLKSNDLNFFNAGWLYEWFMEYVTTEEHIKTLKNSLKKFKKLYKISMFSKHINYVKKQF